MIDLLEDTAATLTVYPSERMAAPSCSFVSPTGKVLSTPSVTVDSVDTTVATDATNKKYSFLLDDATGVQVGAEYLLTDGSGWSQIVRVSAVDGDTVTLESGLPEVPDVGSTFEGLGLTVSLTTTDTATRGVNYRLVFTEGQLEHVEYCAVVRHKFAPPATPAQVRAYLVEHFNSKALNPAQTRTVAAKATKLVWERIMAMARYPQLFGPADAFETAGGHAILYVLAHKHGLTPAGHDKETWLSDQRAAYREEVADAVHSLKAYDANDDGDTTNDDNLIGSIRLTR